MGVLYFVLFLVILFLIGLAAHFLSTQLYRRLVKTGNTNPRTIRIISFVGSFLVIFVVLAYLFLINLKFER
jgi:predicted PurR-regulated permease PerM